MIIGEIEYWITRFVKDNRLGRVFGAETGFILEQDPDTVRAPDVAVLLTESLRAKPPESAYWPGAPDLAVEVLSPTDTANGVRDKTADWLAGGAKAVWIVDGDSRTITIHEPGHLPKTLQRAETLKGGNVLPGFTLEVGQVFEGLE
jgi:Uma2 family endonuclease